MKSSLSGQQTLLEMFSGKKKMTQGLKQILPHLGILLGLKVHILRALLVLFFVNVADVIAVLNVNNFKTVAANGTDISFTPYNRAANISDTCTRCEQ